MPPVKPVKRRHSIAVTPKSSKGDNKSTDSKTPKEDEKPNRPTVKIQRKKKVTIKIEPEVEPELPPPPSPEPDKKEKRKKNRADRKDRTDIKRKTENFYPLDDPERVGKKLHGVVEEVQKAVSEVLDEHVVRCTVPLPMIAAACRKLRKKLADRRIVRDDGSIPALEASLEEVMSEFVEDDICMNKSVFIQEVKKYLMIAASQLFKLDETAHLKIVQSLAKSKANLIEYEKGAPQKIRHEIWEHFEITKHDFVLLPEHSRWMLTMRYYDDMMKYHDELEAFLNKKYAELQEQSKIHAQGKKPRELSKNDPFKHWPEGRVMEMHLSHAFNKQRDIRRLIFNERDRIAEESARMRPYWDAFRLKKFQGWIGVRNEEQERLLETQFAWTPRFVIMALIDHEKEKEEEEERKRMEKEAEEERKRMEKEEEERRKGEKKEGEEKEGGEEKEDEEKGGDEEIEEETTGDDVEKVMPEEEESGIEDGGSYFTGVGEDADDEGDGGTTVDKSRGKERKEESEESEEKDEDEENAMQGIVKEVKKMEVEKKEGVRLEDGKIKEEKRKEHRMFTEEEVEQKLQGFIKREKKEEDKENEEAEEMEETEEIKKTNKKRKHEEMVHDAMELPIVDTSSTV